MSIITISRGSYTKGVEVAEEVARRLGYRCVAREVLLEASIRYNVPEAKLIHAVEGSVSFLDRLTDGRRRYLAYIRAALLEAMARDDLVYHGFAGQFLVSGVDHVLKVRIEATLEERVRIVVDRDQLTEREARELIARNDREREAWSLHLHGIAARDPGLYDLVLRVGRLSVEDAAELICRSAALDQFHTTPASRQHLDDLALAARVECVLAEATADVKVVCSSGAVTIRTLPLLARSASMARHLERLAGAVAGVSTVTIDEGLRPGGGL